MNKIYLSTGAFTGRVNGRDPYLVLNHWQKLRCDGFEFMIFPEFTANLNALLREYKASGISFPVLHTEKDIGSLFGAQSDFDFRRSLELIKQNLFVASELGAKKAVLHLWGREDSDKFAEKIYDRAEILYNETLPYGIDVLVENIFCVYQNPLLHLEKMHERCPKLGFIFDTRPAQFHGQLDKSLQSPIWQNVRHIHINDYNGGYLEWGKINPITRPPHGNVDWNLFFSHLKRTGYQESITLEAPAHIPDGVDDKTLNEMLDFIRNNLI